MESLPVEIIHEYIFPFLGRKDLLKFASASKWLWEIFNGYALFYINNALLMKSYTGGEFEIQINRLLPYSPDLFLTLSYDPTPENGGTFARAVWKKGGPGLDGTPLNYFNYTSSVYEKVNCVKLYYTMTKQPNHLFIPRERLLTFKLAFGDSIVATISTRVMNRVVVLMREGLIPAKLLDFMLMEYGKRNMDKMLRMFIDHIAFFTNDGLNIVNNNRIHGYESNSNHTPNNLNSVVRFGSPARLHKIRGNIKQDGGHTIHEGYVKGNICPYYRMIFTDYCLFVFCMNENNTMVTSGYILYLSANQGRCGICAYDGHDMVDCKYRWDVTYH